MLAGVAVALLCAGGASPLSAQGGVPVIPARAFTYDTVPARLDSLVSRARRDTTIRVTRNGPAVLILTGPRRKLADSLPVWCHTPCVWEWDEIQSVPQDATGYLLGTTWGLSAIGAPEAWALGATGRGVKVGAMDSGIDPTHPGYVVGGGYNAMTGGTTDYQDDLPDCRGHGTHVGGTMADRTGRGVAPGSMLYGLKVFEPACGAWTSRQIAALQWATDQGIRCVNVSIGGSASFSYRVAIQAARTRGTLIFAASGNSNSAVMSPALEVGAVAVGSVNGTPDRSWFSNYGPQLALAAPGEGVESTMPGGGYGTKSGTSMAAPHVAGACALVLSVRPDLSADAVDALLKQTAQPIGTPTPNDYTGYGLVRPDRAIAALALEGPSVVVAPPTYTTTQTACADVNGTLPFTATTDATWLTVWTTPDRRVCWTADLTRAPAGTTTDRIYLKSRS